MKRSPRAVWVETQGRRHFPGQRVLDIGFVGDYPEPYLHMALRRQNPQASIVGVDIDASGVLKWRLPQTLVAHGKCLPFKDGSFGVVLCLEVLEHQYSAVHALAEFWRVLRPGGDLIITTPNAWSWWNFLRHWMAGSLRSRIQRSVYKRYLGSADHKLFYDPLSLMNLLDDAGFTMTEMATKNHAIPYLQKWIKSFGRLDWQFYPMNRMGHYLCFIAKKDHSPSVLQW